MRTNWASLAGIGVLAVAVASVGWADVISVNFVGGRPVAGGASVTGVAGAVPVGNWNNAAGASGSILSAINNFGTATGATVSWTSPNTWSATAAAPGGGGSADMMSGYLDNLQSGGSISATNIPLSFHGGWGYDVYVYFNTDSAGVQGYTATDNTGRTDTAYGQQAGGAGTNYPLGGPFGFIVSESTVNSAATPAANAVLLQDFIGSSFTITPNVGASGDGRVRPNGFQIVANAPEPATLAIWTVLGLGLACLALRRKKQG